MSGRTIVLTADPGARHPPPPLPSLSPTGVGFLECRCERVSQLQETATTTTTHIQAQAHTRVDTPTHTRRHTHKKRGREGDKRSLQEKIERGKGSLSSRSSRQNLTHSPHSKYPLPFPSAPAPEDGVRRPIVEIRKGVCGCVEIMGPNSGSLKVCLSKSRRDTTVCVSWSDSPPIPRHIVTTWTTAPIAMNVEHLPF